MSWTSSLEAVVYLAQFIDWGLEQSFWDLKHGVQHDLTEPKVVSRVISEIQRGRVMACMLAPPCDSFTRARDRFKITRDSEHHWGVPSNLLCDHEKEIVQRGNAVFRAVCA